jgi:hypothetical protein
MAVSVNKTTARTGRKEMTFLLTSPAGCGSVIVYVQGTATLSNGDRVQVEGTFETRHLRDGSTFNNEMQATENSTAAIEDAKTSRAPKVSEKRVQEARYSIVEVRQRTYGANV